MTTTEQPTLSILDEITEISDPTLDTTGIGGTNLRLRPNERTIFGIEAGVVGYITCGPRIVLSRVLQRDQGGMPVLQVTALMRGEQIGLLLENDVEQPLRPYTDPAFAPWRDMWKILNMEFQNPSPEATAALIDLVNKAGFVNYTAAASVPRVPEEERLSVTQFDREAPGGSVAARALTGVPLDSLVILPDEREGLLMTSYDSTRTGEHVERQGFTNFVDVLVVGLKQLMRMKASGDTDGTRQANRNLNVLTGLGTEGKGAGYPLRPTFGYLTPAGGDELDFFPPRAENADATVTTTDATTTGDAPTVEGAGEESPFGAD